MTSGCEKRTFTVLASSYASAIIVFGSLYMLLYLSSPPFYGFDLGNAPGWHRMPSGGSNSSKPSVENYAWLISSFIYFSMSTMAGTGINGYIIPSSWYAQLACTFQMIFAVIYSVVIFGLGMSKMIETLEHKEHSLSAVSTLRYAPPVNSGDPTQNLLDPFAQWQGPKRGNTQKTQPSDTTTPQSSMIIDDND